MSHPDFDADLPVTVTMSNAQRMTLFACVETCLALPNFADADDLAEMIALRDMLAAIADHPNDVIHDFTL